MPQLPRKNVHTGKVANLLWDITYKAARDYKVEPEQVTLVSVNNGNGYHQHEKECVTDRNDRMSVCLKHADDSDLIVTVQYNDNPKHHATYGIKTLDDGTVTFDLWMD